MGIFASFAGSQAMAGVGNFLNAGISRFFKKKALLNDPSNYLKGMEKAGLNPLTMGNQTPSQVGQSTVNSQMSSPTEAMLAGVQLAKASSEIEQNKAEAAKSRKDIENVDSQISYRSEQERAQRIKNEIAEWTQDDQEAMIKYTRWIMADNQTLKAMQRNIAEKYAYKDAELNHSLLTIQEEIKRETGMDHAEAEIAAMLILAAINEQSATFWGQAGLPPNYKPSGSMGLIATIYSYLQNARKGKTNK
jgi:hypothetical protein